MSSSISECGTEERTPWVRLMERHVMMLQLLLLAVAAVALITEQQSQEVEEERDEEEVKEVEKEVEVVEVEKEVEEVVVRFQQPGQGASRRRWRRAWLIPKVSVPENDRGPFPKLLVQVKSDTAGVDIRYALLGDGADQHPVGLFVMDTVTGRVSVTRSLDREVIAQYRSFTAASSKDPREVR
ncbi:cadherin-1-like [Petromyzon marinus]|uniref:cadherin-1-like n=1 Tax=Petromyzon marinus TaxID=7757 RepID=UPI003F717C60